MNITYMNYPELSPAARHSEFLLYRTMRQVGVICTRSGYRPKFGSLGKTCYGHTIFEITNEEERRYIKMATKKKIVKKAVKKKTVAKKKAKK